MLEHAAQSGRGLIPNANGDVRIYGNPVGVCHHRAGHLPQRGDIERFVPTGRCVHLV
ncbi:hypothetical protein R5W23_002340 [Gemmata sp. JC673]|uniref:Uncharacterized protein n=1 Tax=Gemmata algarum TaxID=2975278 RepID=A0ABU5F0I3_9BACT|nr:hypothetical protein [Gemmata algarum]MDY3561081.1 hypothetical protein [Gemmata algarum]